jgi:hypothetical protein
MGSPRKDRCCSRAIQRKIRDVGSFFGGEAHVRRARIALLAIVLLGAAGVALIESWTREWPSAIAPAPPLAEERAAPGPRSLLAREKTPPDAAQPRARSADAPRPARSERQARQGAPTATRAALVSPRREMKAALAALQRRVARCGAADAWFTLDLETVAGGVRVVEAHVEFPGSAGEAGIACARSILVGETIAAPSARPGRRWQLSFAPGSAM